MPLSITPYVPHALLAVYAGSVCCLNVILFLIASFYQRKFNETSPRLGFVVGGILAAALIAVLFIPLPTPEIARITEGVLLAGAALVSGSSTVILYFIMRRSKK